jgi:hypothetical protein
VLTSADIAAIAEWIDRVSNRLRRSNRSPRWLDQAGQCAAGGMKRHRQGQHRESTHTL